MKEAVLNPGIDAIEKGSAKEKLFNAFVDIAKRANDVVAPDFTANPPMLKDEEGNQLYDPNDPIVPLVDVDAINRQVKEYTEIQTKNNAYEMADAISGVLGGGSGDGPGDGFLPLAGGTLTGRFVAKYGVELGDKNERMIFLTHTANNEAVGYFDMQLVVRGDVSVEGNLSLSDDGITFNKHQTIYVDDQTLNIDYQKIKIAGPTQFDDVVTIGALKLDGQNGITYNNHEFYHSGNSNKSDVDWDAHNLHAYGNLTVDGSVSFDGRLSALKGFDLGEAGSRYLYSSYDGQKGHIWLAADLTIVGYDNGIKFDNQYIIRTHSLNHDAISIGAPGRTLKLGDGDEDASGALDTNGKPVVIPTKSIALQTDFRTADNTINIITPGGRGHFLGLSAKSASAGATVLETYVDISTGNEGVLFNKRIALSDINGPSIYSDDSFTAIVELSYLYNNGNAPATDRYWWSTSLIPSDSLFRDPQVSTPTLLIDTDAQFIRFNKPTEARKYTVISTTHKTSLEDGILFLNNDGTNNLFIQAISNGLFFSGNAFFNKSLSSAEFTSGLSGYGWGIIEDKLTGNYAATFDELTVRKKTRFYELEVQKQSITNGSWWVTDACSGDYVVEV